MPGVAEMVLHLPFQRGFHDYLRQPRQQPALTGQPQALGTGPLAQLPQQLLIHRVRRNRPDNRLRRCLTNHISRGYLLNLWSYTD
jgi:hypothetical protein